jgi:phage shock protein C
MMDSREHGLYKARDGIFAGVCKGVADYFDFSVFWTRVLVVVALFITGFWPILIAYIVAACVMKPAPVLPINTDAEAEFYQSYASSSQMALQRLKSTFDKLDRRLQRMEHVITTREYDWERRMRNG